MHLTVYDMNGVCILNSTLRGVGERDYCTCTRMKHSIKVDEVEGGRTETQTESTAIPLVVLLQIANVCRHALHHAHTVMEAILNLVVVFFFFLSLEIDTYSS